MKIIFLGATKFSKEILKHLIENNIKLGAIFTIPEEFHISYSTEKVRNYNYADLSCIAEKRCIQLYEVDSVRGKKIEDYYYVINNIKPDVILAMGWYYMVPKKIRELATYGVWGIHASLLPKYAGGAPLVWAIINGEDQTGVTLFRMDEGVDDGDIITQKSFLITFEDAIKDVYKKAAEASKEILINTLSNIHEIRFSPQDKSKIEVHPQRKPEDGLIDWNQSAREIYNFVRAQTKPYPGAYAFLGDEKVIIWRADVLTDNEKCLAVPGQFCEIGENYFVVITGRGKLKITDWDCKNQIKSIRQRLS